MRWSIVPSSRSNPRGFTLAEILVSLALVGLLMISLHRVLHSATRYYTKMTLTTDLQQSAILATSRLVTELLESTGSSIRGDSTTFSHVTFGSPRNPAGGVSFQQDTGELLWHQHVGYYLAADPQDSSNQQLALFRKERALSSPATSPPVVPVEYNATFWNGLNQAPKLVARQVYHLEVVSETSVRVILGVRSKDRDFVVTLRTALKPRN